MGIEPNTILHLSLLNIRASLALSASKSVQFSRRYVGQAEGGPAPDS